MPTELLNDTMQVIEIEIIINLIACSPFDQMSTERYRKIKTEGGSLFQILL